MAKNYFLWLCSFCNYLCCFPQRVYRLKNVVARAYASKRATSGDNIAEACTACEACKEHSIRFVINIQICSVFDVELIRRGEDMGVKSESMIVLLQTLEAAAFGDICSRFFFWKEFKISGITRVWLLALRTARRHARGRSLVFVFPLCAFAVRSRVRHHDLPCLCRKPRSL